MVKMIWFDMDGTLANFYGVNGWLDDLMAENTRPYEIAKGINLAPIAHQLRRLSKNGYKFGIVSWTSKGGSEKFNSEVAEVKKVWLKKHLPSVEFEQIIILPYGTPKSKVGNGILFDDEIGNRTEWKGVAYDVENIASTLRTL